MNVHFWKCCRDDCIRFITYRIHLSKSLLSLFFCISERIVGATETVADDQNRIRDDLRHFMEVQTNNSAKCTHKPDSSLPNKFNGNDLSNEINKIVEDLNIEKSKPVKVQCEIPQKITDEISQLLLNSSRTVELLQNHSHINQISMNASIIQLENEVSKLHEIRENSENRSHVTSRPDLLSGLMEFNMEEMSNNTKSYLQHGRGNCF